MWSRSLVAEAQAAREMISESGSLLADIERELGAVLTAASRALLSDDQELACQVTKSAPQ